MFLIPTPSGQNHQAKVEIIRPQAQCQHGQLFLNMNAHHVTRTHAHGSTTCCASGSTSLFLPSSQNAIADWVETGNAALAHHENSSAIDIMPKIPIKHKAKPHVLDHRHYKDHLPSSFSFSKPRRVRSQVKSNKVKKQMLTSGASID